MRSAEPAEEVKEVNDAKETKEVKEVKETKEAKEAKEPKKDLHFLMICFLVTCWCFARVVPIGRLLIALIVNSNKSELE